MRKTLSFNGTALPGFAEPTKKTYQLDYYSTVNASAIEAYAGKNAKTIRDWQDSDFYLSNFFPVNEPIDHRSLCEDPTKVNEWMYNTRILDIVNAAGKPGIQIKLPQYVSVRPNWVIALNTFIQAVDGGILETIQTITRVLNDEKMWKKMTHQKAVDRERLFMIRWLMWQLLKTK